MSSFPLYDSLTTSLPKKDLTIKQKDSLIKKISEIDDKGKELIYALIQFHSIKDKTQDNKDLPYKGVGETSTKKARENLTWNLDDFPTVLKQILYKFVLLHEKTLEESKKLHYGGNPL